MTVVFCDAVLRAELHQKAHAILIGTDSLIQIFNPGGVEGDGFFTSLEEENGGDIQVSEPGGRMREGFLLYSSWEETEECSVTPNPEDG